jgi:enamine deaminase RidA (YjgF/YER057c/UK114 family)
MGEIDTFESFRITSRRRATTDRLIALTTRKQNFDRVKKKEDDSMAKSTLNPAGLPVPRGSYSLVNIAQPGRMVFIAGQTASDPQGNVVGIGDVRAQTRYIIEKIQRAIEAAGGTMNDLVAMSVFTTDVRYHRDVNEVRRELLGSNFPTSTMVQVVALARPELLLEINATAVIG